MISAQVNSANLFMSSYKLMLKYVPFPRRNTKSGRLRTLGPHCICYYFLDPIRVGQHEILVLRGYTGEKELLLCWLLDKFIILIYTKRHYHNRTD